MKVEAICGVGNGIQGGAILDSMNDFLVTSQRR
jgi:hypothetical protein